MKEKEEIVWAPCGRCSSQTMHTIQCKHEEDGGEHYHCKFEYAVISCRGCGHSSFRYVYKDFEAAYPTYDDEWNVPETIEHYPKSIDSHREMEGLSHVPDVVGEIYTETLTAIREGASVLAGLGLRGTIEAVCNERGITGKDLKSRIAKLAQQGLISQKDAQRLHGIRFLGNDAAHEIKQPSVRQLQIALRIIEHMIVTVYVLDHEARRALDTLVSEYPEFEKLLRSRLRNFKKGDEYPMAKFLETDVRRIEGGLTPMESQLIAAINDGTFTDLQVGKVDVFGTSQSPLQHYIYQ